MCGRTLHAEFLQEKVTVENLHNAYKDMDRKLFLDDAKELRGYLQHGSSATVAKLIEN
jgi:lipid-A-disaccharide synthase